MAFWAARLHAIDLSYSVGAQGLFSAEQSNDHVRVHLSCLAGFAMAQSNDTGTNGGGLSNSNSGGDGGNGGANGNAGGNGAGGNSAEGADALSKSDASEAKGGAVTPNTAANNGAITGGDTQKCGDGVKKEAVTGGADATADATKCAD